MSSTIGLTKYNRKHVKSWLVEGFQVFSHGKSVRAYWKRRGQVWTCGWKQKRLVLSPEIEIMTLSPLGLRWVLTPIHTKQTLIQPHKCVFQRGKIMHAHQPTQRPKQLHTWETNTLGLLIMITTVAQSTLCRRNYFFFFTELGVKDNYAPSE